MKLGHFKRLASITDYYFYKRIKQKRKLNKGRFEAPGWELRKEILRYYKAHKTSDESLKEAIKYIREEGMSVFPYMFRNKYDYRDISVFRDIESDLKYVKYNAHNLFFPSEMSDKDVQICYSNLQIEQDPLSPHCYLSEAFNVSANDIFLDVGAAEGILSLSVIDKVYKVLLFEVEEQWIKALKKTFEPWGDKVQIINKYVSDENSDRTITIDSLANTFDTNSIFIKLDVEGAERKALKGAKKILTSSEYKCKAAICTYHKHNDYEDLSQLMKDINYEIETTDGYMLFTHDLDIKPPYFRKALIRCQKALNY